MLDYSIDNYVSEYEATIAQVDEDATDEQMIAVLMRDGEWTKAGASALLHLARRYGSFILRNAFALAEAMEIEDGSCGL